MIYHRFFESKSERALYNELADWMVKYHPYWSNIKGMSDSAYLHDTRAFGLEELVEDVKNCLDYDVPVNDYVSWEEYVDECCYNEDTLPNLKKPVEEIKKQHLSKEAREKGKQLIKDIEEWAEEDSKAWDEDIY